MAADGVQQPLLSGSGGGPAGDTRQKPPDGVKRFRRCRTAPSSDPAAAASEQPRPPAPPTNASQTSAPPKKVLESSRPSPSFRLVGLLLLAYLLAGTTAFYLAMDHMSGHRSGSRAIDALYFCVVTMTTVGYGDLVPSSGTAKLLASAFAFGGVAVVGTSLSKSADYLVEKQESLVFRAVHANGKHPARELRAMEANKTWYKLYASAALLAASVASGTLVLWKGEGMRPVDALYCVCVTVTTLGYGDRSFTSSAGRAFAAVWVTVSTAVVALFFLYVAELYAERRQRELVRWVLTRRTTNTDLEAADLDGDRRVGAAEFVMYKLKELGKISQEEISEFLEEFDQLDADHNGTLSPSDLAIAQATA